MEFFFIRSDQIILCIKLQENLAENTLNGKGETSVNNSSRFLSKIIIYSFITKVSSLYLFKIDSLNLQKKLKIEK
jgi:hypothetical protein